MNRGAAADTGGPLKSTPAGDPHAVSRPENHDMAADNRTAIHAHDSVQHGVAADIARAYGPYLACQHGVLPGLTHSGEQSLSADMHMTAQDRAPADP